MAAMCHTPTAPKPQLVLGFGNTPRRAIDTGITAIADLLNGD
jgi:GntR family transcriptional regulator/MocR family aminotransferase